LSFEARRVAPRRAEANPRSAKRELAALLLDQLFVRPFEIAFADAQAPLNSEVEQLGLEQLPADFLAILALAQTAPLGLVDHRLDRQTVLRSDSCQGVVHLPRGDAQVRAIGGALFLVIGLADLVTSLQMNPLDAVLPLLAFVTNVLVLSVIAMDLMAAAMIRAHEEAQHGETAEAVAHHAEAMDRFIAADHADAPPEPGPDDA
jgi:hypothetical protein